MRTLAAWVAVAGVFAGFGSARAGEKEAREIIDRAIRAHGGAEAMAKVSTFTRTDRGKQSVGAREESFVTQVSASLPDKVRLKIEMGKKYSITIVLDGETGYRSEGNGPATKMLPQRTREIREEAFLWWITTLVPLTRSEFTLSTLQEIKIQGQPAAGIEVKRKGHAATKLYFNKRSGFLIRAERRVSVAGLAVEKEYEYEAHKRFGSVFLATKLTEKHNKIKWTEFTISDYAFPEKLEASVFAKP